ncbi:MAG: hypothetical protein LBR17_08815 [Bacteroidales bacterium]|jgi:UDP-N-acetylmuramoylalanine--D-glutamate ligase|nr:hypothetical protein [Bacteroidales bacterium]
MATNLFTLEQNKVNYTGLAARNLTQLIRMRKKTLVTMFDNYSNSQHRSAEIAIIKGIRFIDDAQAINPNMTWFMLESLSQSIIWIMGAENKYDLTQLVPTIREKVRIIINCGNETNTNPFKNEVSTIINVSDLTQAVRTAFLYAAVGETVVFSPACGEKKQIIENANRFIKAVNEL